jgi:outer membrane lipoprotein SlyB
MTRQNARPTLRRSITVLLLAACCGCAGTAPETPAAASAQPPDGAVTHGVIVSVRAVTAGTGQDLRRLLGAAGAATDPIQHGNRVEIIVRDEHGQAISLVQTNDLDFRPGERILLIPGARSRIARPGA